MLKQKISVCFTMRIKPTSTHEDMRICYRLIVVTLLYVSVTFCDHLQRAVMRRIYYTEKQDNVELYTILNFKYTIQYIMLKYTIEAICILYFNTHSESLI